MYDDRRKAKPDPELRKYIEKARSISGVAVDPKVFTLFFSLTAFVVLGVVFILPNMDPDLK